VSVSHAEWRRPPAVLGLGGDEVHVWRASLLTTPRRVEALARSLAPDELERSQRFHFQARRERYIVARGLLREILSLYLDARPGETNCVVTSLDDSQEAGRWSLRSLSAGDGYAASVAAAGSEWKIRRWRWPEPR
jgi:hypothetical protein